MAPWCRGAAYVPWHGSTSNVVNKVPGRAVVQRKLKPSWPICAAVRSTCWWCCNQALSIIIIMPAAPKACLLQRAACRATCGSEQ